MEELTIQIDKDDTIQDSTPKWKKAVLCIINSKQFEDFFILIILINGAFIASSDYGHVDNNNNLISTGSVANTILIQSEIIFTILFTLEMVLKCIAFGFYGPNSYLSDSWHWLDMLVVFFALFSYLPGIPNIKVFRTFRELRPLKSLKSLPGVAAVINVMIDSLIQIKAISLAIIFFLIGFSIIGLQLFNGPYLHTRCRMTPFPVNSNWTIGLNATDYRCLNVPTFNIPSDEPTWTKQTSPWHIPQPDCYWPIDESDTNVCALSEFTGDYKCSTGFDGSSRWCGSNYDAFGNARFNSKTANEETYIYNLGFNQNNFDNLGYSILFTLQVMIGNGWSTQMEMLVHTIGSVPIASAGFCILIILLGSLFLLQLNIAVFDSILINHEVQLKQLALNAQENDALDEYYLQENQSDNSSTKSKISFKDQIINFINRWDKPDCNSFRLGCKCLFLHPLFGLFFTTLILLNMGILAVDHYPDNNSFTRTIEAISFLLTIFFTIEMIVVILGVGIVCYFSDFLNIFDFLSVVFSLVDVCFSPLPEYFTHQNHPDNNSLSSLRAFRLLRLFRIIRSPTFNKIIFKIVGVMYSMLNFLFLLGLYVFIMASIGMQFFANYFRFDSNGYVIYSINSYQWINAPDQPLSNFDNFTLSIFTIFQLITLDNWTDILYNCYRVYGSFSLIFPLSIVLIGNFFIMNLFLAMLINNFTDNNQEIENSSPTKSDQIKINEGSIISKSLSRISVSLDFNDVYGYDDNITSNNTKSLFKSTPNKTKQKAIVHNKDKGIEPDALLPPYPYLIDPPSLIKTNKSFTPNNNNLSKMQSTPNAISSPTTLISLRQEELVEDPDAVKISILSDNSEIYAHIRNELPYLPYCDPLPPLNNDDVIASASIAFKELKHVLAKTVTIKSAEHDLINENDVLKNNDKNDLCATVLLNFCQYCRQMAVNIIHNPLFETTITAYILASSISILYENPLTDPNSKQIQALGVFDVVVTSVFIVEMILKWIALGLFQNNKSYFRNSWCILDFVVVVFSIVGLFPNGKGLSFFKALRVLRALRPLRLIQHFSGLRAIVTALITAIPSVSQIALVFVMVYFMFGVFFVSFLKGDLRTCSGDIFDNVISANSSYLSLLVHPRSWNDLSYSQQSLFQMSSPIYNVTGNSRVCSSDWPNQPCCPQFRSLSSSQLPTSRVICECWGGEWSPLTDFLFDNVGIAMLTLFDMGTFDNWSNTAHLIVSSRGIDMQPIKYSNMGYYYAIIIFMLMGGVLLVQLFIGAITESFQKCELELGGLAFLSPEQREWINTKKIISVISPVWNCERPTNKIRIICFDLTQNARFDLCVNTAVICQCIALAMVSFGQSDNMAKAIDYMNLILTIFFSVEMILKLVALGSEGYFFDTWNRLDFGVALGSIGGYVYLSLTGNRSLMIINIIRVFRILRLLRLIKGIPVLQKLISTIILTIPGIGNIAILLFLSIYIFTVIAVNLFAKVEYNGYYSSDLNFRSFSNGFLSFLVLMTAENWGQFMMDLSKKQSGCVDDPSYDSRYCGFSDHEGCMPLNGCGSSVAIPVMIFYIILVTFILLSVFVSIIISNYKNAQAESSINVDDLRKFASHWSEFDPKAIGYIRVDTLFRFVETLFSPLGFECEVFSRKQYLRRVKHIKLHRNHKVFFVEVLIALSAAHYEKSTKTSDDVLSKTFDISLRSRNKETKRAISHLVTKVAQKAAKTSQGITHTIQKSINNPTSSLVQTFNTNHNNDISVVQGERTSLSSGGNTINNNSFSDKTNNTNNYNNNLSKMILYNFQWIVNKLQSSHSQYTVEEYLAVEYIQMEYLSYKFRKNHTFQRPSQSIRKIQAFRIFVENLSHVFILLKGI
eukprot:gene8941-12057_t